jgi:hypothetical protein
MVQIVRLINAISFICVLATIALAVLWYLQPDGNYEPITVALGGVSAILITISQVLQRRMLASSGDLKSPSNMSRDEILQAVKGSDPQDDWDVIYSESGETAIFTREPNLHIEHPYLPESLHNEDFREKWANKFPDPHATSHYYDLYYGSTRLERFILVHVDGGRACLPLPISTVNLGVQEIRYRVAMIFDKFGTCNDYMRRAGLHVLKSNH